MAGAIAIFDSQDALYVSQTENVYSWVRQLMDSTKPHYVRAAIAKRFFGSSHEISPDTMDDRVAAFLEGCSAGVFLANNRNEAIALKSQLIEQLSPRLQEKTKATRRLDQTRSRQETDKIRGLLSRVGKLSHVDDDGRPRMVDVTAKAETAREATAAGSVYMTAETLVLATSGRAAKGDVLSTAQLAGIMAAKRTHELIPLCHPLPLTAIEVDLATDETRSAIDITAMVRTTAKTGVEMEALTAVTVAALTVYDMLKAAQKDMRIGDIRLVRKTGGKSGDYVGN